MKNNKKEISLDPSDGIKRHELDPFKCLPKEDRKKKECEIKLKIK